MVKPISIIVVAGVVVQKDGKYLLVQERQPKAYKLWNLPAGKVDEGMTIEDTAVKEAKEETGYKVRLCEQLGMWHEELHEPLKYAFAAEIVGGELRYPKEEIMDARWFTLEEVKLMQGKLRGRWVLEALELISHRANKL